MSTKVVKFKAPALARQTKPAFFLPGASLADIILLQLLEEADAPAGTVNTPAQIFDIRMKRGPLRIVDQRLLRLTAPFKLAFWLS